jgi:hypothetical protein
MTIFTALFFFGRTEISLFYFPQNASYFIMSSFLVHMISFFLNHEQKFKGPDLKNVVPQNPLVQFKSHHLKVKEVYNQQNAHIKNRKHSYMFQLLYLAIFRKYQSAAIIYFTIYKCKAI